MDPVVPNPMEFLDIKYFLLFTLNAELIFTEGKLNLVGNNLTIVGPEVWIPTFSILWIKNSDCCGYISIILAISLSICI